MLRSPLTRSAVKAALAASALLLAQSAAAQEFIKGGDDTLTLNAGAILTQFGTKFVLNGTTTPGTPIDLENNGLSKDLTSFVVSGTWRWAERHRSDFLYYSASRNGNRVYNQDLQIGNTVIPAGYNVNADAKDKILFLDYRYSFYKSEAFEGAAVLGVYGGNFKFNMTGTGTVGAVAQTITTGSSTTVPMPLIGASGDWYISPRWKVSSLLSGMAANVSNVNGHAIVFQAGTDYMLTRNWGLGLSYLYSGVNVDVTKSGFNGSVNWKTNSVLAYATLKF